MPWGGIGPAGEHWPRSGSHRPGWEVERKWLIDSELLKVIPSIFSGQNLQERSLSCAIWGNEGHLVPLIDIEVNSLEQDLWAITLGNVLYLQITWHRTKRYAIFGLILAMASKKEDSL